MNRGQLRTLTSLKCEDPNLTKFTSTMYNDSLERAQLQFCLDTWALFKDAPTITVVDGTASYDLPSDFIREKLVTHKGLKLDPISRGTLLFYSKSEDWTTRNGTPTRFNIDPEEARKKILLYRNPTGADAGANLVLTYYPSPAAMSSDSSTPFNGSSLMAPFHVAVPAFSAHELLGFLKSTPEGEAKRANFWKEYQDKIADAISSYGNTKSESLRMKGGRG